MRKIIGIGLMVFIFACQQKETNETPTPAIIQPPGASTLSLPKDKELCLGGNKLNSTYTEVSFEWQSAKNTDNYDLTITNLNTNTSETKFTSIPKMDVILEAGVPYSWFVTSKSNTSSIKTNSTIWKFYLSGNGNTNLAPYPADGLIPKSGSTLSLVDGKATLSWIGQDPDSNNLSYEVYLDTDQSKVSKHEISPIKSTTNLITTPLKSGQIYYWQIKSSDGILSSYTQVYSFRTI